MPRNPRRYGRVRIDPRILEEFWSDAEIATAIRLIAFGELYRDERSPSELYITWNTLLGLTGRKAKSGCLEHMEILGERIGFKLRVMERGVVLSWPALAVERARSPFTLGGRR